MQLTVYLYPQKHMFLVRERFFGNQFYKSKYYKSKQVEILLTADYKYYKQLNWQENTCARVSFLINLQASALWILRNF